MYTYGKKKLSVFIAHEVDFSWVKIITEVLDEVEGYVSPVTALN